MRDTNKSILHFYSKITSSIISLHKFIYIMLQNTITLKHKMIIDSSNNLKQQLDIISYSNTRHLYKIYSKNLLLFNRF